MSHEVCLCVCASFGKRNENISPRNISQLWSFKCSRDTLLSYLEIADLLILKLSNCETARRVAGALSLSQPVNPISWLETERAQLTAAPTEHFTISE